jgi:hypothetical protein
MMPAMVPRTIASKNGIDFRHTFRTTAPGTLLQQQHDSRRETGFPCSRIML